MLTSFSLSQLILISAAYLLVLFGVAWVSEHGLIPRWIIRHPLTYILSLGVYASAWAFYGTVGLAYQYGYGFLASYLGVSGAFLLAPVLLYPILRITRTYQLSSLADLFAFRFRSTWAGALTTVFMLIGVLPLLALQIQAVADSISILTHEPVQHRVALSFCALITLFTIFFGSRHIATREKHEGLVFAIACTQEGYVPTHNLAFSQPLTGDPVADNLHNRSKRKFADRTGIRCGSHQQPLLLQTYTRDTGELMHDLSVPIWVQGRHWGGLRLGYKPEQAPPQRKG